MFPCCGNVFVKQSSEFDKQEGFSSEKCVVEYENAVYSGLTKWLLYSGYGAFARERVNSYTRICASKSVFTDTEVFWGHDHITCTFDYIAHEHAFSLYCQCTVPPTTIAYRTKFNCLFVNQIQLSVRFKRLYSYLTD